MKYTIHCDGGSLGNPGYGYGSFRIEMDEGGESKGSINSIKQKLGEKLTCNEAEYRILILCLQQIALRLTKADIIEINTDSILVVHQMTRRWKCKKPHLKVLRDEAVRLLSGGLSWSIQWVGRSKMVELFGH